MSIAVLTQVYTEARRLAVAGSVVARGDFRLKKLLPALEQAGKQAPVFAKIAEVATAVIEGPEKSASASLLELTSLVNAVLYTQGETGMAGAIEPIPTSTLSGNVTQTSARLLKPLLEALSSTGSGRLELIRDAHERGLFEDLRLVKPALAAIDDPYPEVGMLIAEKVLPLYGQAILPELRAKYDPKGTKGHPRRLVLMNQIDPAGTRDLIKSALENGSKEVKVAAITCLGGAPDDLAFLIEQANAKTQDVRHAAYRALAKLDRPEAVATLAKALTGKDYHHVASAIQDGKVPVLVNLLVAEIRAGLDSVSKMKDKKKASESIDRTLTFLNSFPFGGTPESETLLLELFAKRAELAKIKGDYHSGKDIVETVINAMSLGSAAAQKALVKAHAELSAEELVQAFQAARYCLSSADAFKTFSPYLTATCDEKKKAKDPAYAKREALINTIGDYYYSYYFWDHDDDTDLDEHGDGRKQQPYDPRWLDLAVELKRLNLVSALVRPGHKGALAYVKSEFDAALKKAKNPDDVRLPLNILMRLQHPEITECFFAALAKRSKKGYFYHYYFVSMVPKLSKDALPRLEEMVASLPDSEANYWLDAIHELRTKN